MNSMTQYDRLRQVALYLNGKTSSDTQLFWYREGIARIVLNDKVRMQLNLKTVKPSVFFPRLV